MSNYLVKMNLYFQLVSVFLLANGAMGDMKENLAEPGQLAYMAQIARVAELNSTYKVFGTACGGSLISLKWVLTAGKCFPWTNKELAQIAKNATMIVIMGTIINLDFSANSSRRFIIKIVRHPDYQDVIIADMESVSDDIAVAEVQTPFLRTRFVHPVALSTPKFLAGKDIADKIKTCIVMGFGGRGSTSKKEQPLTYSTIQLVSASKFNISNSANVFISVSAPDEIKHQGDLGSPVMCAGLQFGIVSSLAIIDDKYIDTYTEVAKYDDFLAKNVPSLIFGQPQITRRAAKGNTGLIYGQIQMILGAVILIYYV